MATASTTGLWQDRNFLRFWVGQAFSQLGAQVTKLAIPVLAVVMLQATETQVGYLNASGLAAFLLVGLPAGAWIDRMRKRRVMIIADGVRALALATIPLLHFSGLLQLWHLYLVALIQGTATVFFDVSYQSVVPALVAGERIAEANGRLESTQQIAGLTGPAVAGWLVGLVTAPLAMVATSGTYLVSMTALLLTRDHEELRPRRDRPPLRREIAEGLRWVFGNPLLRRIVATSGIANLSTTLIFTLMPIFVLRTLGFSPARLGLLLTVMAIGGLLGAMATPQLAKRFGESRLIPLAASGSALAMVLVPLALLLPPDPAFWLLAGQGMIANFHALVYNITQVTFRQRHTPAHLLGRMNASVRFFVWGVMPIAALLAGWVGSALGIVATLWIGVVGCLVSALPVVLGPFWQLRDLPNAASAGAADSAR